MVCSCIYSKTDGKIKSFRIGRDNFSIHASTAPTAYQEGQKGPVYIGEYGIVLKAPKEIIGMHVIEVCKQFRVRHANSDGTVELERVKR